MGNRKQPFGYKMEFGEIVPQPQEAETIRSIYLQYLAGASFKQLTEGVYGLHRLRLSAGIHRRRRL